MNRVLLELLMLMLDGALFVNALRPGGKPCRIRLPEAPNARRALVQAHLDGSPATLTFLADGHAAWEEHVPFVALAAFCPDANGGCPFLAIDLDGADHGPGGLANPTRAMRCVAERAAAAGLLSGLVVARSRGGNGWHLFLVLRESVPLEEAVIGVAALAAAGFNVANEDVGDYGVPHAFLRADGRLARPGDAGAVELIPRSTVRPQYGWPIALPAAGAFAANGGGVIWGDPFADKPVELDHVPHCDPLHWSRFVSESRAMLPTRPSQPRRMPRPHLRPPPGSPLDRIDPRTRSFLDGNAQEGSRNHAAFAASANLLGRGVEVREAERLVIASAVACGLPEREARAAFASALGAMRGKGRVR